MVRSWKMKTNSAREYSSQDLQLIDGVQSGPGVLFLADRANYSHMLHHSRIIFLGQSRSYLFRSRSRLSDNGGAGESVAYR